MTVRSTGRLTLIHVHTGRSVAAVAGVAGALELGAQIVAAGVRIAIVTLSTEVGVRTIVAATVIHRQLLAGRTTQTRTLWIHVVAFHNAVIANARDALRLVLALHLLAVFVQLVLEVALPFALRTAFTCGRFGILAFGGRTLLGPALHPTMSAHAQLTAGREVGAMQIDGAGYIAELYACRMFDDLQSFFGVLQLFGEMRD